MRRRRAISGVEVVDRLSAIALKGQANALEPKRRESGLDNIERAFVRRRDGRAFYEGAGQFNRVDVAHAPLVDYRHVPRQAAARVAGVRKEQNQRSLSSADIVGLLRVIFFLFY